MYASSRLCPLLLLLTASGLACSSARPRSTAPAARSRPAPVCSYRGVGFTPRDGVLFGPGGDPRIKIKAGRQLKIRYEVRPGPGGGRVEVQLSEIEPLTSTARGLILTGSAPLPAFAYLVPAAPLRLGGVIIAAGGAKLQPSLGSDGRLRVTLEAPQELSLPRTLSRIVRCEQVRVSPGTRRTSRGDAKALALGDSAALEGYFGVGLGGPIPFSSAPGGPVEARLELDAVERNGIFVLERRGAHTRLALRRRTYWLVGWVPSELVRRESMGWGGSQQTWGGEREPPGPLHRHHRRRIVFKRQAFATQRCSRRITLFVRKRTGLAAAGAVERIGALTPGREIVVVPQDSGWYTLYLPKASWWEPIGQTDLLVRRAEVDRHCPAPR